MPAQPGSQPPVGRSMKKHLPAGLGSRPAAQATFGQASKQPAGRWAGLLARRAARQLPAKAQPVQNPENFRFCFIPAYVILVKLQPNTARPRKKKFGKSPASQLVGQHVSHSSQLASRQALQPAVGQ